MKFSFLPKTCLGKWSIWLVIGAGAVFLLLSLLGENVEWLPEVVLSVIGLLLVLASLAAGVTGVIAFFKHKDHSFLVLLAILVGVVSVLRLLLSAFTSIR